MDEKILSLVVRIAVALENIACELSQIADAADDLRPPRYKGEE